jgi:hypothetical protein
MPMIKSYDWDIFENRKEFGRIVEESDVVIAGTDTDSSRYFINDVCVEKGKPLVVVSMFEKGAGGEVFTYIPGNACYACVSNSGSRKEFLLKYMNTLDKRDCSSARDVTASPGLGIDQSFLCSIAARKALDVILSGTDHSLPPVGTNWIIWSLFGIKDVFENHLSSILINAERQHDCMSCSH